MENVKKMQQKIRYRDYLVGNYISDISSRNYMCDSSRIIGYIVYVLHH